jgi:NarL family two-component system response regulator LiaR
MSNGPIRVFVVDDHPMIRVGLVAMIQGEHDLRYAGEAGSGEEALRVAPQAAPDVVLLDLVMPQMDGVAVLGQLRPRLPGARFLMLTSLVEPGEVQRALAAGATGYVLKSASSRELVAMIRDAARGRRVLSAEATDALVAAHQQPRPGGDLTQRERELLALMARGLNNAQIGAELAIAMPTVKFHITNILDKLQVANRTEAVLLALKYKLVPPPG